MVASFSPHRDAGGGTLHFPSPSGLHHSHTSSAISQLRRSLSRSPSKGTDFRLLSPSKLNPSSSRKKGFTSSPLSPSKYYPQGNIFLVPHNSTASPVAIPFPPSAKIHRPTMRRSGALQSSRTRSAPSPSKRVLAESRDNGNSGPIRLCPAETIDPKLNVEESPSLKPTQLEPFCFAAPIEATSDKVESKPIPPHRIEKRRSGNFGSFASTSSPLKRGESGVNLGPPGSGSPSPKRRSTHGASFESEFDLFESAGNTPSRSTIFGETEGRGSNPFATIPKRSTSLRKSTLQQRQIDRPLFPRTKSNENQGESAPIRSVMSQSKQRMSLDNDMFSPTTFDHTPSYNAPTPLFQSRASFPSHQPSAHPLSRAITQSSSNSSFADDSPTHRPLSPIVKAPKPILNFSKSLPAGSTRPVETNQRQESFNDGDSPFATPENYKFVKPLPAAFMSTGLISKKNKNPDMHNTSIFKSNMPDTPCKRMSHIFTTNSPLPRNTGLNKAEKRYNGSPWASFDSGKGSVTRGSGIFGSSRLGQTRSRRESFASIDGENGYQSPSAIFDTHYNGDSDLPPTPTKQGLPREKSTISDFRSRLLNNSQSNSFDSSVTTSTSGCEYPAQLCSLIIQRTNISPNVASPVHNRFFDREVPQTPREHIQPPDPSGLSISARSGGDRSYGFMDSHPSGLPATPTAPRESFSSLGKRASLSLGYSAPDVDPSLTARFDKVELVGSGEFSLVYSVTERRQSTTPSMTPVFSLNGQQNSSSFVGADKVWAVKKSKQPYAGANDRRRRHNEVVVLKELGNSDHIINFIDSWEDYNYLYIQTEFCEEGSLDVFLSQVGLKARLDDFRIWKILLELSHVCLIFCSPFSPSMNFTNASIGIKTNP